MTTCVRCGADRGPGIDEDGRLLPLLDDWVFAYDQQGGMICPNCATPLEVRRENDQCVRCGLSHDDWWHQHHGGTDPSDTCEGWLRLPDDVVAHGFVCPGCMSRLDEFADVVEFVSDVYTGMRLCAERGEAYPHPEMIEKARQLEKLWAGEQSPLDVPPL